jgi:hypothetical protein
MAKNRKNYITWALNTLQESLSLCRNLLNLLSKKLHFYLTPFNQIVKPLGLGLNAAFFLYDAYQLYKAKNKNRQKLGAVIESLFWLALGLYVILGAPFTAITLVIIPALLLARTGFWLMRSIYKHRNLSNETTTPGHQKLKIHYGDAIKNYAISLGLSAILFIASMAAIALGGPFIIVSYAIAAAIISYKIARSTYKTFFAPEPPPTKPTKLSDTKAGFSQEKSPHEKDFYYTHNRAGFIYEASEDNRQFLLNEHFNKLIQLQHSIDQESKRFLMLPLLLKEFPLLPHIAVVVASEVLEKILSETSKKQSKIFVLTRSIALLLPISEEKSQKNLEHSLKSYEESHKDWLLQEIQAARLDLIEHSIIDHSADPAKMVETFLNHPDYQAKLKGCFQSFYKETSDTEDLLNATKKFLTLQAEAKQWLQSSFSENEAHGLKDNLSIAPYQKHLKPRLDCVRNQHLALGLGG